MSICDIAVIFLCRPVISYVLSLCSRCRARVLRRVAWIGVKTILPVCNAASTEQDVKLVFVRPDEGRLQAMAHETVPAEFDAYNETQPTGILRHLRGGCKLDETIAATVSGCLRCHCGEAM
jgi:hypothetical protein